MIKTILRTILFFSVLFSVDAAGAWSPTFVSRVHAEKGEKWWGIFSTGGPLQPFSGEFSVTIDQTGPESPFTAILLSSNGRYFFSDEPVRIEFTSDYLEIGSDADRLQPEKAGRTLREAYLVCCHKYFPPSGLHPDPDLFSMPIYDLFNTFGCIHTQDEVLAFARRIRQENLPAGIILIPEGWRSTGSRYEFDPVFYPDPLTMSRELKELGFRIMLTVTPYAAAYGRTYFADLDGSTLLRGSDGTPSTAMTPYGWSVCYDLDDPSQLELIESSLKELVAVYGIDGYRLETGGKWFGNSIELETIERLAALAPLSQVVGYEGRGSRDFLSDRHASVAYDRPGMITIINDMVASGFGGRPYTHIYTESTPGTSVPPGTLANSLFLDAGMPVMTAGIMPWQVDSAESAAAVRDAILFREKLSSYARDLVTESARTGEPLVRPMEYQFPKAGFSDCNNQYMLGPRYMFVINPENSGRVTVRLPKGNWVDRNGKRYRGPVVTNVDSAAGGVICFEHIITK